MRGSSAQSGNLAFAVAAFIFVGSHLLIGSTLLEHSVVGAGDLVRGSDDGLFDADLRGFTSQEGPVSAVAAHDGLGSQAEGLSGTIVIPECFTTQDLASGGIVVGGQAKPRAEVFPSRPGGHVRTRLGDEGLHRVRMQAHDGHQVDACEAIELSTHVKARGVFAVGVLFGIGAQGGQLPGSA